MTLPDLSRLLALDPKALAEIGKRLRDLGLDEANAWILDSGLADFEPVFRPIREHRLRAATDPGSIALRAFLYADPITEDEATRALGDAKPFVEVGLLERVEGGLVSPFEISWTEDLVMFGDRLSRGGDAVMSIGPMTLALMRAAWPPSPIGRALDLGCGSGACALLLAETTEQSIGSDINPRTALFGQVNARLNAIGNVTFRVGDMYAPLQGETFDLIVSQPPFLAKPDELSSVTFMWGGARGDELPLRALAEAPRHLAPGGRAMMAIQWPLFDDDTIEARVRLAVTDSDVDVLLLEAESRSVEAASIGDAATEVPELGPEYERKARARRAHFDRMGVRGFHDTLVVLQRHARDSSFTGTVRVAPFRVRPPTRAQVDALVAAHALASRPEALLDAKLRLPHGTVFAPREGGFRAIFPADALHAETPLDTNARALLQLVDEVPNVRTAVKRLAQQWKVSATVATERVLPAVANALRNAILVTR